MADSLARTKLNVFLSFTTLVCSSICFYDTFFLVLPNASFVVSAEKVLASGIAGAYLFFFFAEKHSGLRSFARRGRAMGTV